jgi:hypothetical protein
MDEVSAHALLTDSAVDPRLAVSVPRREVEEALRIGGEPTLLLDVVRTSNGDRQERRVSMAWDREALERVAAQGDGENVTIAIDPESLQVAFDEVEAHGLREIGATLAIAVTAVAGGAGVAGAAPAEYTGTAGGAPTEYVAGITDFPAPVQATVVDEYQPGVTDFPSAVQRVEGAGPVTMPQAMLDDYAAAQEAGGADIEAVRAAQTAAPDPTSGIENVRVGGTVTPDPSAAIETVRAGRTAPEADDGGITISAPTTGEAAAMAGAGAAALAIAGAAFALRRKGQPEPV